MTSRSHARDEAAPEAEPLDAELGRTIEHVLLPRLLLAHRLPVQIEPPVAVVGTPITPADVEGFAADLLSADEGAAAARVRALLAGGSTAEAIMLDLLSPTARQMGDLWDQDVCDFVAVTVALGRIQRSVHELSGVRAFRGTGVDRPMVGKVLLACAEGDQHLLGLLIAAEFFARDEWEVVLGPPVSQRQPAAEVQHDHFDIVGFSVGSDRRLDELAATIAELRRVSSNPAIKVIVGGPWIDQQPDCWQQIGADAASTDAREAPRVARGLLPTSVGS